MFRPFLCIFFVCWCTQVGAQETDGDAKATTTSPYFFVASDDPELDQLPLKSTQVQVSIVGVIADVMISQSYRNEGKRPIAAKYVFPGSTHAALHGMTIRIDDRLITAQIREREQAQAEFRAAQYEGKAAALLEQHRPNVFEMNVANIMPGDEVWVEIKYTELLIPQGGKYQFVYPTVVGPRYNSPHSKSFMDSWVATPIFMESTESASDFSLVIDLFTPVPLQEVSSPSHSVEVSQQDVTANIRLVEDFGADNRDFILDYRLTGDAIDAGVMLFRGERENFFLAMVQPPKAISTADILPRDYIFVVDVSGSMSGFPLDTAKAVLRALVSSLRSSDTFNVLLFAGNSQFLAPQSVPATQANIDQALAVIDGEGAGGATELMPALRRVYAQTKPENLSRTIVVITDGYVTVESEAFQLVRENLGKANLFSFGIGSSVNRHLMEGLARAGMGEPTIVTSSDEAKAAADRFRQMVEAPVLTAIRARFAGLDVYDVEPRVLPDVLSERPVVLFGKWRNRSRFNDATSRFPRGQLIIDGTSADGPFTSTTNIRGKERGDLAALRYLWARHRIARLTDQEALDGNEAQRQDILELGLKYNLLTQYTSFIAVDHVIRNQDSNDLIEVKQPLPLPEGVSNFAVGTHVPATPEPSAWLAISALFGLLAYAFKKRMKLINNAPTRG